MSFTDQMFKFIGSRWFTFFLGLALIAAIPFTWHNFQVVQAAGQAAKFWWVIAILIINIISIIMCIYKFMTSFGKKNQIQKAEEW
jgi:type VI protein secretion system component VasK